MSTLLTADTHFGHESILPSCRRPWTSVREMDDALVNNWNAVVHRRDTVWHLGDFGWADDASALADLFSRLNGTKHLVLGNHDLDRKGRVRRDIAALPWASVAHAAEIKHAGRRIALSHYAGLTWSAEHYGACQAFGHSHGNLLGLPGSVDVGVDAQGYRPVSVDEFLRQADDTLEHAAERIERLVGVLRAKAPRYRERLPSQGRAA